MEMASKNYNESKRLATEVYDYIQLKLNGSLNKRDSFFLDYPDVEGLNLQDVVLVLGLNPSYTNENKKINATGTTLLNYVPQAFRPDQLEKDSKTWKRIQSNKLVYTAYFKTYVELFQQLGYNPLWFNKTFLTGLIEDTSNRNKFDPEILEYLNYCTSKEVNEKYIVFADLIQFPKTDSSVIKPFLDDHECSKKINKYLEHLISFIKPKLVLCANAAVSHYLVKNFNNDLITTSLSLWSTDFVLSSMLTGQRAMDRFSRERLIDEIGKLLSTRPTKLIA